MKTPKYIVVDENGIKFWVKDTQTDRRLKPEYTDESKAQKQAEQVMEELLKLLEKYEIKCCKRPPTDGWVIMSVHLEVYCDGAGSLIYTWEAVRNSPEESLITTIFSDRTTEVDFDNLTELRKILTP